MNFKEYKEQIILQTPPAIALNYEPAYAWPNSFRFPVCITAMNDESNVIRIPDKVKNEFGDDVGVIRFSRHVFAGRANVTDIILPSSISKLPKGAFAGCSALRRITIPKNVTRIEEGTFAGCDELEDVYFEGSMEEWEQIKIVHQKHEIDFGSLIPGSPVQKVVGERLVKIPGNEALFSANIHFRCDVSESKPSSSFCIKAGGEDITNLVANG